MSQTRDLSQRTDFSLMMPRCVIPALSVLLLALSATASAGIAVIEVSDAQVVAGADGSFELPFSVQRSGDMTSGVRLLLETAEGGSNPAQPGDDYLPLPYGTPVLLPPGADRVEVGVSVLGGPVGPDKTVLLRINEARAFSLRPHFSPALLRLEGACCEQSALLAVDLNGDGHQDLVTGNGGSGSISVLLADGEGGHAWAADYALPEIHSMRVLLAAADVNGNGHTDLVVGGYHSRQISLFTGDGSGGLSGPQILDLGHDLLWPNELAIADVTGNGHQDIVTANGLIDGGDRTLSVMQGDGAGGFQGVDLFPALGHKASAIAIADISGNGHPDLVVNNLDARNLTLLAGGSGGFAAPISVSVGPNALPQSLIIADVTGNGHLDIATANDPVSASPFPDPNLQASVSILEGDGSTTFADLLQMPIAPGLVRGLAAGDVTGNGHVDLVVARLSNNKVTLVAGQGQGEYFDPMHLPVGANPQAVVLTDLTGNGHADVAVSGSNGVSVLPADGQGAIGFGRHFAAGRGPVATATADLNGDGHPDVVTVNPQDNSVSVLLGDGEGGFGAPVGYPVGISPMVVRVADMNDDGIPDLVVANAAGASISVLSGDGDGGFVQAGQYPVSHEWILPFAMTVGDVTGNGCPDVVTANTHQGEARDYLSVLAGNCDGTLSEADTFALGDAGVFHYPQSMVLVDVDGSGHLDVVTTNFFSGNLSLLSGDGEGNFSHAGYLDAGPTPVSVAAGDVTGNGHPDLVVVNTSAHAVSVLHGDGAGGFSAPAGFGVGPVTGNDLLNPWPTAVILADLTGDGHLDVAVVNTQTDSVAALANDGQGGFPAYALITTGARPYGLAAADFTGDGNLDLVTANRLNDNVTLLPSELATVTVTGGEALGTIIYDPQGGQPGMSVAPDEIDFGEVLVGALVVPVGVTIESTGTAGLEVQAIDQPSAPFMQAGGNCAAAPFVLAPGESCELSYMFMPMAAGSFSTTVTIQSNAQAAEVTLLGVGVTSGPGPEPEVTFPNGTAVHFGNVAPGDSTQTEVVLHNSGSAQLKVSGVVAPLTPFSLHGAGSCPQGGFVLDAGSSCTWIVVFAPVASGDFDGQLTLISNAASSPDHVTLNGTGQAGDVLFEDRFE